MEPTSEPATFQCEHATPLDLIQAVGFQTRTPIGLELGSNPDALTKTTRAYNLDEVDAAAAITEAQFNRSSVWRTPLESHGGDSAYLARFSED
jgi:hypothetical protein